MRVQLPLTVETTMLDVFESPPKLATIETTKMK
jgi:hypothetical protein